MKRKIMQRRCQVTPVTVGDSWTPSEWLLAQGKEHGLKTLLAHADDGLIWGEIRNEKLHLSGDEFPEVSPPLRTETLWEARLFGPTGELRVWRGEDNDWTARSVLDDGGEEVETFDEYQMLWGTVPAKEQNGFTLVTDGQLGNRHAPPLPREQLQFSPEGGRRPLRLQVRHYLRSDESTGLVAVNLSRLVAVVPDTEVIV